MRKITLVVTIILSISLFGCASEEDKSAAQFVINQIDNIGTVNLDKANEIYKIQKQYSSLDDKQKKLVKNYESLTNSINQLEDLIEEKEIKNDPTNTITKTELIGIWEEDDNSEIHRGYLYFANNDYLYYMGSKQKVTQSSFTNEHLISTSYELGDYNRQTRAKEGKFYCIPIKDDFHYSITKTVDGEMTLNIEGQTIGGAYHKLGEKVDLTPIQCLHSGCTNKAVTTGDSIYCESHSNKCTECGKYIDEDAIFCLNCIVEALRKTQ